MGFEEMMVSLYFKKKKITNYEISHRKTVPQTSS